MKKKQIWWIGIGAAVTAAAAVFFFIKKASASTEKPPKKAPQLNVENPGDQSEFTTAPSDSELG
jgi:hypothetical protein